MDTVHYANLAAKLAEEEAQELDTQATKLRMYAVDARAGHATCQMTHDAVYVPAFTEGGRDWSRRIDTDRHHL